jgi:Putative Ig domain/Bacterial Ig-like domain (group 3)
MTSHSVFGRMVTKKLSHVKMLLPLLLGLGVATATAQSGGSPTYAFEGAYNNVDSFYPDGTPMIREVTGDGVGPWVSGVGHTITIMALGDQQVPNYAYSPSATTAPFSQQTITRHYGFGSEAGTVTLVGIDGVSHPLTGVSWSDKEITGVVPSVLPLASTCPIQQQLQNRPTGTPNAVCAELVITATNGKSSIDTITVTIGGKAPTHVAASGSVQAAIDAAKPGDLIIVDPTCVLAAAPTTPVACTSGGTFHTQAVHQEQLLMWKPVRLQGVGARFSVINASSSANLGSWRAQAACLFGVALNGQPITQTNPYDPSNTYTCSAAMRFQVDRLPLESTLNGNLLAGLEGAGITVLSKGVNVPGGSDPFAADTFPDGTTLLTAADCTTGTGGSNLFPSNFQCNPSSIDGLGITSPGSSLGGGGIFVHAWGHNLQISNNWIYNNTGTLSGGITVGQRLFPPAYISGSAANAAPGSCQTSSVPNLQLPYCHNLEVNVHNNSVTLNSSTGASATPAAAGGASFFTGADFYEFNYNWVNGNLSVGDGGGLGHLGFIYNGDIEHNSILFNQSTNPTTPTDGGGVVVEGLPHAGSAGLSDGTGPVLMINANLIQGNAADNGSGGGIRLHSVDGAELTYFPAIPARWYHVSVTNNIIANNVAGWDGAGISLQDSLNVDIINNTIASNVTTGAAAGLFNPPLGGSSDTSSQPQPSGLASTQNSAVLTANLPASIVCPAGHFQAGTTATDGTCRSVSYPLLDNNIFWQNSAYYIGVAQNVATLYNAFTTTPAVSQPSTDATTPNGIGVIITGGNGACTAASYWDIGVRGDTGPYDHRSGYTLAPTYSVLTEPTDSLSRNIAGNAFVRQYCNGSRVPPDAGGLGWQAALDGGNNSINISWGPLSTVNLISGATLADYALAGELGLNYIPSIATANYAAAPSLDFFDNPRKTNNAVDVGAVESTQFICCAPPLLSIAPNTASPGQAVSVTLTGTNLTGTTAVTVVAAPFITVSDVSVLDPSRVTAVFTIPLTTALGSYSVNLTAAAGTSNAVTLTLVEPNPVITSAGGATFTVGTAGSFVVTATGDPAPTFTETGTLPSGVSFNPSTGVLSGTPAEGTGGTYGMTLTASNGVGTAAMQSFVLTVNQAPAITSANSVSFAIGKGGSFTVTASGFPAPTFGETGTLPSGVSFNSSTGVLSGSPAAGTGGAYNITFTASNTVGTPATQSFALSVNNTPAGTNISVQPIDATTGSSPVTLIFSTVGQGGTTSLATGNAGPVPLVGFVLGTPPVYYNLATTAIFSGPITVCINYTGVGFMTLPQLFHYIGSVWQNVTTSVDRMNHIICGATTSLSPFAVFQGTTSTALSVSPGSVNYSDFTSFSATVTPASAGGLTVTGNLQFYLNGSAIGSAVPINSSGVATLSQAHVNLPGGNYPVSAVFTSTNPVFPGSSGSATQAVTQENAFILYSGDTIAQVGSLLTLRATVWDSAAVGYPGANPETGPTATIGDITKMWIAFDIYPAGSCGSGTPSTQYAQVGLTSVAGVGTATGTLTSSSEVSYCVVTRLVAGNTGGTNLFYAAADGQAAGADFYVNSGQFAIGGGWVSDPTGTHGNFGFIARYNSSGSLRGQMVYVYRGSYNGVLALFIIKSNALSALQFSGKTYPISATLQGKASVQVNRASDGHVLFSAGTYTFKATVTDSGQNGTKGKQFSLVVYNTGGIPYHSVPAATPLQGGNVVVHPN